MPEANREGKRRTVGRGMLNVAVLPAAALLALAFATPAHADDQSAPPPLMLSTDAVIVTDEPDATVDPEAAQLETASAPAPVVVQATTKVVAAEGWELAAKPQQLRRVVHRLPQPAAPRETPPVVISSHARPVHRVRPHHAVSHASRAGAEAPARWYQIAQWQYRQLRAKGGSSPQNGVAHAVQPVYVARGEPSGAGPRMAQKVCAFRTGKCLELCAGYADYKATQNGRWIGVCNYVPVAMSGLDRLHASLLDRLWLLALNARAGASAGQYQCLALQYQSGTCSAAPQGGGGTRDTPRQPARSRAHHRKASRAGLAEREGVAAVDGTRAARVLAAVATYAAHTPQATRHSRARAAAKTPGATREAAATPGSPGSPSSSDGWFLRTLIALTGIGILALLLAARSELRPPTTAFTGVRSRLGSRGLSASRVVLGEGHRERRRRRGRISYRD